MVTRTHPRFRVSILGLVVSLLGPAFVTGLGVMAAPWLSHSTLLIMYLMVVLTCALLSDWVAVLVSSIVGFLLFNFFHTQPSFSLAMHNISERIGALVYFFFALVAGATAYRARKHVAPLTFQKQFLSTHVELFSIAVLKGGLEELSELVSQFSTRVFGNQAQLSLNLQASQDERLAKYLDIDIYVERGLVQGWQPLVQGLGLQLSMIVDRYQARQRLLEAERETDEEKLRNALLSSVSHDLKTPLVTMLGSATCLRDLHDDLSADDQKELLASIISESHRLEAYIQNLLDMTKLGQGAMSLRRQWVSAAELIHAVKRRLHIDSSRVTFTFQVEEDLPSIWVHAALIEQALFNAIDNSVKASPDNSTLLVKADLDGRFVVFDVCDQGPGVPTEKWEAIFDQFYTFKQGDTYTPGSGLGLTICRGMARVHGGEAKLIPAPKGYGFCLRLSVPVKLDSDGDHHE